MGKNSGKNDGMNLEGVREYENGDCSLSPFQGTRIEKNIREAKDMGKTYEIQGKRPVIGKNIGKREKEQPYPPWADPRI